MNPIEFNDLRDLDIVVAGYGNLAGQGEDDDMMDIIIAIVTISGD